MTVEVRLSCANADLLLGLVEAEGVVIGDAPAALEQGTAALLASHDGTDCAPEAQRRAIRDVLRQGGFQPTGRNKPASDYLAKTARDGTLPAIHNVVAACNLHSLDTGTRSRSSISTWRSATA